MRILCTADVHIGRRPSRLPQNVDAPAHSCAAAWLRIVERALGEQVDLVTVSGDLVDQANRFYEAVGPLERGIRALAEAGITTVMVAGNHDHDVLPFLVEGIGSDRVRLLGRGGRWERMRFEKDGTALDIDGWSFPQSLYSANPLADYSSASGSAPVLGLLHADLDQARSSYAPVPLPELRRHARTCWALGHIHQARLIDEGGGARVLYPGSPQAMDPGEPGMHGVWLIEVGPAGFTFSHQALSTVRYDVVDVAIDGIATMEEVDRKVYEAVSEHLDRAAAGAGPLRCLRYRVRLTGSTPLHRTLEPRLKELVRDMELHRGEVSATVEQIEVETWPARDLEALAAGTGAPAVLARLIRQLEEGELDPEAERLVADGLRACTDVARARPYFELGGLDQIGFGREEVAGELRRAATVLIDELVGQKEEA